MDYAKIIGTYQDLVERIRKAGHKKIYLSHQPWEEKEARNLAKKLRSKGIQVVIAADIRPHKDKPHSPKDLEPVRRAIASCDAVVLYHPELAVKEN